jgi:hypothetical protein
MSGNTPETHRLADNNAKVIILQIILQIEFCLLPNFTAPFFVDVDKLTKNTWELK